MAELARVQRLIGLLEQYAIDGSTIAARTQASRAFANPACKPAAATATQSTSVKYCNQPISSGTASQPAPPALGSCSQWLSCIKLKLAPTQQLPLQWCPPAWSPWAPRLGTVRHQHTAAAAVPQTEGTPGQQQTREPDVKPHGDESSHSSPQTESQPPQQAPTALHRSRNHKKEEHRQAPPAGTPRAPAQPQHNATERVRAIVRHIQETGGSDRKHIMFLIGRAARRMRKDAEAVTGRVRVGLRDTDWLDLHSPYFDSSSSSCSSTPAPLLQPQPPAIHAGGISGDTSTAVPILIRSTPSSHHAAALRADTADDDEAFSDEGAPLIPQPRASPLECAPELLIVTQWYTRNKKAAWPKEWKDLGDMWALVLQAHQAEHQQQMPQDKSTLVPPLSLPEPLPEASHLTPAILVELAAAFAWAGYHHVALYRALAHSLLRPWPSPPQASDHAGTCPPLAAEMSTGAQEKASALQLLSLPDLASLLSSFASHSHYDPQLFQEVTTEVLTRLRHQTPHDPQPLSWLQRLMGAGPSSGPEARVAYVQPASPSSFSLEALSELASALVATKHHLLGRDGTCTKLLKAVCHTASSQMLAHIGQHLPLNDAQAAERAPASQLQASVINTARLLAALGQAGHLTLLLLDSSAAVTAQALAHPSQPGMPTQVLLELLRIYTHEVAPSASAGPSSGQQHSLLSYRHSWASASAIVTEHPNKYTHGKLLHKLKNRGQALQALGDELTAAAALLPAPILSAVTSSFAAAGVHHGRLMDAIADRLLQAPGQQGGASQPSSTAAYPGHWDGAVVQEVAGIVCSMADMRHRDDALLQALDTWLQQCSAVLPSQEKHNSTGSASGVQKAAADVPLSGRQLAVLACAYSHLGVPCPGVLGAGLRAAGVGHATCGATSAAVKAQTGMARVAGTVAPAGPASSLPQAALTQLAWATLVQQELWLAHAGSRAGDGSAAAAVPADGAANSRHPPAEESGSPGSQLSGRAALLEDVIPPAGWADVAQQLLAGAVDQAITDVDAPHLVLLAQVHISLLAARGPRYLAALTTDRGGPRSPDWLNKLAYAWGQYIGPAVQRQQQLPSAVASLDAKTKGMPASAPATSGASELSSAQLAAEVLATLQADPPHGEPAPGPAPSPDHPPSLLPQGLLRLSLRPQPSTHYPLAPAAGTSVVQVKEFQVPVDVSLEVEGRMVALLCDGADRHAHPASTNSNANTTPSATSGGTSGVSPPAHSSAALVPGPEHHPGHVAGPTSKDPNGHQPLALSDLGSRHPSRVQPPGPAPAPPPLGGQALWLGSVLRDLGWVVLRVPYWQWQAVGTPPGTTQLPGSSGGAAVPGSDASTLDGTLHGLPEGDHDQSSLPSHRRQQEISRSSTSAGPASSLAPASTAADQHSIWSKVRQEQQQGQQYAAKQPVQWPAGGTSEGSSSQWRRSDVTRITAASRKEAAGTQGSSAGPSQQGAAHGSQHVLGARIRLLRDLLMSADVGPQ